MLQYSYSFKFVLTFFVSFKIGLNVFFGTFFQNWIINSRSWNVTFSLMAFCGVFPIFQCESGRVSSHKQSCFERATWSLAHSFAYTAHSTHLLCSALLCYACFTRLLHSQACSLTLLTPLWDSWNSWICVHAVNAFHAKKRVFHLH